MEDRIHDGLADLSLFFGGDSIPGKFRTLKDLQSEKS
jgi:hypothetical protein